VAEIYDGPHATPKKTEVGPWFLSISSLRDGRLVLKESAHLSEEDYVRWTRRVAPRSGDVLFSYETRLGDAALMPDGLRACLGRRMGLLRPIRAEVNPRFLLYSYLAPAFQREIEKRTVRGATVDRIPLNELGEWPIAVPPLHEQDAIVEVLGALDDKIDCNETILRTSQMLADATWDSLTQAAMSEARCTTLGQLSRDGMLYVSDGYRTKQAELAVQGAPVLRVADVEHGTLRPSLKDYVSAALRDRFARKTSAVGDVVVTTKGTVGRVAMVPAWTPEFVYSPQLCFFRVMQESRIDRHWLLGWLRGPEFREGIRAIQHQTDMAPYVNLKDLRGTCITLPPFSVQRQIGDLLRPLEECAQLANRESSVLAECRHRLLPLLMSGLFRLSTAESLVEEAV
jgi:type I restriction enzyme S subunit